MSIFDTQMTSEEAKEFGESGKWKALSSRQRAELQASQRYLCMPVPEYYKALTEVLDRQVYTHELAFPDHLLKELRGEKPKSTLTEIIGLIPQEKLIIVGK